MGTPLAQAAAMQRYLLILSVMAVGCGPMITSGGFRVSQRWYDDDANQIKPRAAFELHCAAEQIQLVVLSTYADTFEPDSFGATGCGQQVVYVQAGSGTWVLNSTSSAPRQQARTD